MSPPSLKLITLLEDNASLLRQRSQEVTFPLSPEIIEFITAMQSFIETLQTPLSRPAGLAAPLVGKLWRIVFIQIPEEAKRFRKAVFDTLPLTCLINPVYTPNVSAGKNVDWEGCYSVPDKMGEVERYNTIEFSYYTKEGEKITRSARGFLARLIQHEVDHLDGHLYIDHLLPYARFDSLSEIMVLRKHESANVDDFGRKT